MKLAENTDFLPGKQFFSDSHILLVDRDYFIIQPILESDNKTISIDSLEDLRRYFYIEEC